MLIGVIADDFTGASDIANTLAKGVEPEGGLNTAQFSGIPTQDAPKNVDACVVSLKIRSLPAQKAVATALQALDWLLSQDCQQIIFKYCSTFDSTPQGNIGPVADALADALKAEGVVFCPSFPAMGRTVYMGHLFVNDTLLSESGMAQHPITPMTDSDLRRWLQRQSKNRVGHVLKSQVDEGSIEVSKALVANAEAGEIFSVVDATTEADLLTIGEALDNARLITGGSGVAMGLPRNFIKRGVAQTQSSHWAPVSGPAAVLAGSCSGATLAQVKQHAQSHPTLAIDVVKVMHGEFGVSDVCDFFDREFNQGALVYSSATPDEIIKVQQQFGAEKVSAALDTLFSDTACRLVEQGYTNLVIAGGETSSAVAHAVARQLDTEAMVVGPEIDAGVPILGLGQASLVLKSGNFGELNFFAKALKMMNPQT